tara:strand:+ start:1263 stop:1970 length:708 start_codon:yes stop_codon:yes gene_type:complete
MELPKSFNDDVLPKGVTDFLARHFDIMEQTQELIDVTLLTQAAYNQAITIGYLRRSQIAENLRGPMAVAVGLKITGLPFTWKELAHWFGVEGRRLRIDFFKIAKWKMPREIYVQGKNGDSIHQKIDGKKRDYIPLKLPFVRHFPPPNMSDYLTRFAFTIKREELGKPAYELLQNYTARTRGGHLGGINAQTLGAALLYLTARGRKEPLRMKQLSNDLKVAYNPLKQTVKQIEEEQ